jgi:hypothetical protein
MQPAAASPPELAAVHRQGWRRRQQSGPGAADATPERNARRPRTACRPARQSRPPDPGAGGLGHPATRPLRISRCRVPGPVPSDQASDRHRTNLSDACAVRRPTQSSRVPLRRGHWTRRSPSRAASRPGSAIDAPIVLGDLAVAMAEGPYDVAVVSARVGRGLLSGDAQTFPPHRPKIRKGRDPSSRPRPSPYRHPSAPQPRRLTRTWGSAARCHGPGPCLQAAVRRPVEAAASNDRTQLRPPDLAA